MFPYNVSADPRLPIAHTLDVALAGEYLTYHRRFDPWILANGSRPPAKGASLPERLLPDRDLVKSAFYNDFGKRADMRRLLSVIVPVCSANDQPLQLLTLMRGEKTEPFDDHHLRIAEIIVPHLEAALNLHVPLRGRSIATAAALFEGSGDALALVGRFGFLLHTNSEFIELARTSPSVRISGNHLTFHGSAQHINDVCHRILHSSAGPAERPRFFPIAPAPGSTVRRFLLVAELPAELARALNLSPRLAIVRLSSMQTSRDHACDAAAEAFGLSRAERRVLHDLIIGRGVDEIAARGGTTAGTVRLQLKAIYSKSGIHRQSELVSHVLTTFDPALRIGL